VGALALTALVTWFILERVGLNWRELQALELDRWQWRPLPLAGSVLLLASGYAFSGWLWARMVREMGGPGLGLADAVGIYMVSNLGRYVPGKVVQVAGLAWLARRRGVPAGTAVAAAVVGQGTAIVGATVVGLGAFFGSATRWRHIGWLGVAGVSLFVLITSLPGPAAALQRLWIRLAGSRGGVGGDEAAPPAGDEQLSRPKAGFGIRWTLWYTANWGMYAAAFWLFFIGLEGWVPFLGAGPAFAAAYVAGYLALFAPAGAGVREAALVAFLGAVLPGEAALALALAARLWATAVEVVPAALLAARTGATQRDDGTGEAIIERRRVDG
jgi:hypothetical protein